MPDAYASEYGADGPITAAQRLAEIACERLAAKDGRVLPPRFWERDGEARRYRRQVQLAHKLLKVYDAAAVFAALRANPGVRSLGTGFCTERCSAEQDRIDANIVRAEAAAPVPTRRTDEAPRQGVRKGTSVRSKLQGL